MSRKMLEMVTAILWIYDPVGLEGTSVPEDEYNPESAMILGRLEKIEDAQELPRIIYEAFAQMYGDYNIKPFHDICYEGSAEMIWDLWQESRKEGASDTPR
jgi:hypothetical protein